MKDTNQKIKVLQVSAVDTTIKHLLLPLIDQLISEGYDTSIACSDGKYLKELKEKGYKITPIKIDRKVSPISNLKSVFHLYLFIKRQGFHIVHVHTPVASVVGRIAAKLAGTPIILYTAHGFYFHENMGWWERKVIIWVERFMGKFFTNMILNQSAEDKATAIEEGIAKEENIAWIGNGVDVESFSQSKGDNKTIRNLVGIDEEDKVVGFVGRFVKEKGVEELILAMNEVVTAIPKVKLLIIGDTLDTDRDIGTKKKMKEIIQENNLRENIKFIGFREDVPRLLSIMDLFVLPSYREGMPRSILEAMASGKPVVATNIRGCREEVIDGVTGFLVPIKDPDALSEAIIKILSNENLAHKMGETGQKRAKEEFDERLVLDRQDKIYKKLIIEKLGEI